MSLIFVRNPIIPFAYARINLKMPKTRFSTRSLPSKPDNPVSESKAGSESSHGVSGPELAVFVRKKRVKNTVEVPLQELKTATLTEKLGGLPDIEEFAYGKANGTMHSEPSEPSRNVLTTGSEVSSTSPKVKSPAKWKDVLEGICKMRSSEGAPVDSMGCEKAGSFLPAKERRFAVLVSSLLSSQTKDEVTHGKS